MLNTINSVIWGYLLTTLLIFTGVRLSIKTRFFQLRKIPLMCKKTLFSLFKKSSDNAISPFEAMSTALSGTMGTGNIIGVGTAIALGGAGSIFWMILSAVLCMIIKYAEVALSVKYRITENGEKHGGAMYYITKGMGEKYRFLAVIFSTSVIFTSFGIGAAAQSVAVSNSISNTAGKSTYGILCGVALCVAAACVIFGTARALMKFTSLLVPIMTLTYFIGAAFVLIKYRCEIPSAVGRIFSGVFCTNAAGGGMVGMMNVLALRHGFSKGMFTNEAGMGSAPIVHAKADNTPGEQGLWGMLEVFLDTVVMCTLTALVILVTNSESLPGSIMTTAAFCKVFGDMGSIFIAVCVTLFAFGAIIGWCCYGVAGCEFLFHSKSSVVVYKIIYCAVIILGGVLPITLVLEMSDLLNAFMALPNLIAVNALTNDVVMIIKKQ